MARWLGALGVAVATAGALVILLASSPAGATVNGPCSASIAGEDVRAHGTGATSVAISVAKGTSVPVTMRSAQPITHLQVQLEFGGFRWTVHNKPTTGTSWVQSVAVDRYATYGVGLYKVIGSSSAGGSSCSGAALVKVGGNPLATVAGGVAAGLTAFAALGVAGTAVAAVRGGRRTRLVPAGIVGGLLGGIGAGVLLQQYAVLYPTRTVALGELLAGLAVGLVVSAVAQLAASHGPRQRPTIAGQRPTAVR